MWDLKIPNQERRERSDVKCPLIFLCRIALPYTPQAMQSDESLNKLDRVYYRLLQSKLIKLPTNFFFKTVIENDNFTVTGLFRIKKCKNKYSMGRKIERKSLIFIHDHC